MKEADINKQALLNFSEPRLQLSGEPGTIRQEHTFDAPVNKIWQALTEPKHLNNWFGLESSVAPGVGGTMRHSWGEPNFQESTIQVWEPNARLQVLEVTPFGSTFQPNDGASKPRKITFTLKQSGKGTALHLEHTGFGTTPEWQRFQSVVANCWAYQTAAIGHYATFHFGKQRNVAWARVPSNKSYAEMWATLTGVRGALFESSVVELAATDRYSIRTVTGDVFEGKVISHIPNKQFAATVENMNNSLLRIVLDNPGTPEAGIWLASWDSSPAASQLFEWRWINALQRILH